MPNTLHPELLQILNETQQDPDWEEDTTAHIKEFTSNALADLAGPNSLLKPKIKRTAGTIFDTIHGAWNAYQEWGKQNREMLAQVPGVGPALDFTNQVAETPGMDFMFPMLGYTAEQGMGRMASGIMEHVGQRAPGQGVKRAIIDSTHAFSDDLVGPVRGPLASPFSEQGWRFYGGDKPVMTFPPNQTYQDLKKAYSGVEELVDPVAFSNVRAGQFHELGGHRLADLLTEDEYYRIFGTPKALQRPYNYEMKHGSSLYSPEEIQAMLDDVKDLSKLDLPLMPGYMKGPSRGVYHRSDYDPALRYYEEGLGDAVVAAAAGADPSRIATRNIKNWDPILQHFNLKTAQEQAKELNRIRELHGR